MDCSNPQAYMCTKDERKGTRPESWPVKFATALKGTEMNEMSVKPRPDAIDISAADLRPSFDLSDSTEYLNDSAKLQELYFEQGYLLLRGVLDKASVRRALERMMAVMAEHGYVKPGEHEPIWTGKPLEGKWEESPAFSGISRELIEHPHNVVVLGKILGEPACPVPMVNYRCYPPHTPLSMVHQDGQYSPGIEGYRPVWIPLVEIDERVGGLILAPGQHKRGRLHNLGKPPLFPIPQDAVPATGWATTAYHPGDVLVVHPWMPHVGMANTSDRIRFSIDTRVQSAANPRVVLGDIEAVTEHSVSLRKQDGTLHSYRVDDESYLRTGDNPGVRFSLPEFAANTQLGLRVVAAIEDGRAMFVRRASEN